MILSEAGRLWRRQPVFSLTVVLTLALGLGANTAIFSALNALTLRPLPFARPGELWAVSRAGQPAMAAGAVMEAWRAAGLDAAGVTFRTWGWRTGGRTVVVQSGMFTPGFFAVLGVEPWLGQGMMGQAMPGQAMPDAGRRHVWLTHAHWRTAWGAAPDAVGRTLELNEDVYTVAGVLPEGFFFQVEQKTPDLFFPLEPGYNAAHVIIRTTGAAPTTQKLQAVAAAAGDRQAARYALRDLRAELHGGRDQAYWLLMAAVALVLLAACCNLANLFLVRAAARVREWAVRASLGASRVALAAQFLREAAVLTLAGWLVSLAVAYGLLRSIELDGLFTPALDLRTGAFMAALVALVTAGLTLAPVWLLRRLDTGGALYRAMRAPKSGRLRGVLLAGQAACALALLLVTMMLLRSFTNVTAVDPGFTPRGLFVAGLGLPESRYASGEPSARLYEAAMEKMRAIPGVRLVAGGTAVPLLNALRTRVRPPGVTLPEDQLPTARIAQVSSGYFATLGIPLRAGRGFDERDRLGRPRVAMVNQAFARAFSARAGQALRLSWWDAQNARWVPWEIVGTVGDVRQRLDEAPEPQVYLPLAQMAGEMLIFTVRAPGAPAGEMARAMAAAVHAVDPTLQTIAARPLEEDIAASLAPRRLTLRLVGGFAALAWVLCVGGLFGVTAYVGRERARELAVRRALGARAADVVRGVAGGALAWCAAGAAVGAVLVRWAVPMVRAQLYGTGAADPWVFGGATAAFVLAVLAGCAWPAWRALRLDAAALLRHDG